MEALKVQETEIVETNKGGRPIKQIDSKQFENLCGLQCTQEEIAAFFDCDADTVANWCKRTYGVGFSEVFSQKRGKGKISLRRAQWQLAENNATMAIFLGKQFLGQKDTHELNANVDGKISITYEEALKKMINDDEY